MAEHNHDLGCGACDGMLEREKAAHQAAVSENRSTRSFLLTMTHELRGRLNAITGWVGILRSHVNTQDEICERAIATIERNAWAQARLIDQLLARVEGREAEPTVSAATSSDARSSSSDAIGCAGGGRPS